MKRILSIFLLSLAFLLAVIPAGNSQVRSYYSGDAVYYRNRLIIGSANSGNLELFALSGNTISRQIKFKPVDASGQKLEVSSLKFNEEEGRLYVYLTAQYTVYKYDVSDPVYPVLKNQVKNTIWEWYNRVDIIANRVATISSKNVKILNYGLQNIDAYALSNINAYNVRFEDSGRYIFNNSNNYLQVYDRESRSTLSNIPLNYRSGNEENNHRVYGNALENEIFVVDDYFVKKFDLNGNLKASFRHLDQPGYDVEPSIDERYIYFSNGVGVVKLTQSDLKLSAYKFTHSLGGPAGWAMGLKAVGTESGERLIIFNNSNILVLDDKLNKVAVYQSFEEDETPDIKENLFLNLDHNLGAPGSTIVLAGGGFWSRERLTIQFGEGPRQETTTDNNGRFNQSLIIPNLKAGRTDIKVSGQSSNLSYSIAFEIK